jgi:transcriptional regulator with XRE-family HTH domain
MGKKMTVDSLRSNLRRAAEDSGLTYEEIGIRMGYKQTVARAAVSRLTNPKVDHDPRISTVLSFCDAVHKPLTEVL